MTVGFICTALPFSSKGNGATEKNRGSGVLVVFGVSFSFCGLDVHMKFRMCFLSSASGSA